MSMISKEEFAVAMEDIDTLSGTISRMLTESDTNCALSRGSVGSSLVLQHTKGDTTWQYEMSYFSYGINSDIKVYILDPASSDKVSIGRISSSLLHLHLSSILGNV